MTGAARARAVFFDGHTAQRHPVTLTLTRDARGLVIDRDSPGGTALVWPLDRLRALSDQADRGSLTLALQADTEDETPRDPARLVLTDAALIAEIRARAPGLARGDVRRGTVPRLLSRLALAGLAIWALLFVILPRLSDYLADRMPLETEMRFGRAVVAQMERLLGQGRKGPLICDAPEGRAALDRLAARLTEGQGLRYDLEIRVFDHPMLNAFAAPGGQIVLIRGLLDNARSVDEVAGVLAHEIGHVEARDPTRLMLRAAGSAGIVSVVLGDVTGGTLVGLVGDYILRAAYTREAEGAADVFAVNMLNRAGISSRGMADFFARLGAEAGDIPEILSSHPASLERANRALVNSATQADTRPALSAADWAALKNICVGK